MKNMYDEKYNNQEYYWGKKPSQICYKVLNIYPPKRKLKLLDIGCGEGRNSIFFARNGYEVTAFDLSNKGVEKTLEYAKKIGVKINAFQANLLEYKLDMYYDILFSTGSLHYIPENLRNEILANYKEYTNINGLNVFSVFVNKPFIPEAPDAEDSARKWISGEIFTHYNDWEISYCTEEIFDCISSGIPHKHAINRMIAKKIKTIHEGIF
ncbi:MAG: methyltransferase domain-containing protein [Candidatus Lokiarchaeota archaeon]|nr:methyltransferase domain-containing protein [Candidatus Lokiarchaeota archaeon]